MTLKLRIFALAAGIACGLAGCGGGPPPAPPKTFPVLNYDYLPPILLNVSGIAIQNDYVPDAAAAALIGEAPQAPADVLTAMLRHRLVADGTPGSGNVTIENAEIGQVGDQYAGVMTVRLDVVSADGRKNGYTEASASVTGSAPGDDASQNDVQAALYTLTKQLMDQMNVQLQYQIQHNLGAWVSYGADAATPALNSPATGAIQATPLTSPTPVAAPPATGTGALPQGNLSGELRQ